ncbi:efflux RND transporter periplasmic adaptor subunit [Candidatus Latescibacterota bacterium]
MNTLRDIWQYAARYKLTLFIIIAFILGFLLRGGPGDNFSGGQGTMFETEAEHMAHTAENPETIWTCSMHPQIRQSEPGQCPICGMGLIPITLESSTGSAASGELTLSEAAQKLAEIQIAPVERKFVAREIKMSGKIGYDETRLGYITAWIPGRIDRLYVDYTGITVRKGDHLVDIYSPELLTAQEELIQALKASEELRNSTLSTATNTANLTIDAAREKLRLLGLTQEQISEFENSETPADHVTIYSPMGGIVIHKEATEGMYVTTGMKIFTIADLSQVWVKLDVYESDLEWIRYGQEVEFFSEAYPGEKFTGKIAFIDPVLNDKTRSIKVRVNLPNTAGKLKPDMFVRAVVYSQVAAGGKVMDPSLAGKFICPMHPEIVKNSSGSCDICGMPLVKAETLGYANPQTDMPPLVIPASAPLITGKRAVVYVSIPGKDGTFEGREIVLGPRTGDYYQVAEGLSEGEMVVVNGNFKIDSAVQILAGPSMMSPEGGVAPAGHNHGGTPAMSPASVTEQEHEHSNMEMPFSEEDETSYETSDTFKKQLDQLFQAYFHIQFALSSDNSENAKEGAGHLQMALSNVDMSLVSGEAHMAWMKELSIIEKTGKDIAGSDDIVNARAAFIPLSQSIISVAKMFGTSGNSDVYRFHCPMADNNKGADWLQNKSELENPYFGSAMFKCGELVEIINEIK